MNRPSPVNPSRSPYRGGLHEFEGFSLYHSGAAPSYWPEESHSQIEILVPLEQVSATLTLPRAEHLLNQGHACIIPPQEPHKLQLQRSGELMMIFLERPFVGQAIRSILLSPNWHIKNRHVVSDHVIQFVAENLRTKLSESGAMTQLYCKTLAQLLAIHLIEQYSDATLIPMPLKPGLASSKLAPVLGHIHSNLDSELKVAALAEMVGLSSPHFCRIFKKSTDLSPHRYILLQRIDRAKELLKRTDMSLSDIALQCGFYDQSHFSLQFRNFTGMTPRAYRQEL